MWELRLEFPCIAENRVGACDIHGTASNLHAWAGNNSLVDRFLHINVGVAGAFGFEIADCGESVIERLAGCTSSEKRTERYGLFQDLFIVIRGRNVSLKEYVGVGVDESGQTNGV